MDSWLAVANKNCDAPATVEIPVDLGRSLWARTLLKPAWAISRREGRLPYLASRALRTLAEPGRYSRVLHGHEDFDFPGTARMLEVLPSPPDILHLHNLHGAWFDVGALPALTAQVPTMITLHDVWLLTGHCAYPLDCERWKTGCGDCPYLDLYVPIRRDESASNARIKREAVSNSRVALACPSRWLYDLLMESGLVTGDVQARVVLNGIDTRIFSPGDKQQARAELGLPPDAKILCFAARGLEGSAFKGFGTLKNALAILGENADIRANTLLLALGSDSPAQKVGGIDIRFVPFVKDPAIMARYYRACDLYVHPARAENLGLTILEAMACGIPVAASAVGGVPEIIVDGESGMLFQHDDSKQLAALILSMLADEKRLASLSAHGLERIAAHFTLDGQVSAYLGWYDELLAEWRG